MKGNYIESNVQDAASIDPITTEVVRMRLENVVKEMGISMMRSSGSPVITEAGDFNTALFTADGRVLAYSEFVQLHLGSGQTAVRNLLKVVRPEELLPGDAFISNDPHTAGSTHPPDISVVTPIFHGAELVGFAQSQAHFMDVGGMTAGGFAPSARDCFSEALRLPPGVKILDKGHVVEAVRRILVNNVRLPVVLWNDVRSLIASNNVGVRRMIETIDEVGFEQYRAVIEHSLTVTESVMCDRISALPDGVYEAVEWQEHNGHKDDLFKIAGKLTVSAGRLSFDFSGSSPQTDGFVNCSYGALIGSVYSAVIPTLAWDIPLNAGVLAPVDIFAPSGTIVNPVPPAPVSNGHLEVGSRVVRLVTRLLNMACERSSNDVLRGRAQGIWADSWTGGITSGNDKKGNFFVFFNMDGGGMGSGAQSTCDGLDGAGLMTQIGNILPDVEMNELFYPVLYLWKRVEPKTAGAGTYRGGMGLDYAWLPHGAEQTQQTVFAPVARVPASGYGGGYPGGGSAQRIYAGVDLAKFFGTGTLQTREGATPLVSLLELNDEGRPLHSNDVFHQTIAGGGGFGDPLLRKPEDVAKDLRDGYVSSEVAFDVYGIVVDDAGAPDLDASRARRHVLRAKRLGAEPGRNASLASSTASDEAHLTGNYLSFVNDQVCCRACEAKLGAASSWRKQAVIRHTNAAESLSRRGVDVRASNGENSILLEEVFCAECGTALSVDIVVDGRKEERLGL
ncbi:hydantoinase B/oxoprolinase family protein [Burkholderia sp. JPY481]